jgi:hypothetical protein
LACFVLLAAIGAYIISLFLPAMPMSESEPGVPRDWQTGGRLLIDVLEGAPALPFIILWHLASEDVRGWFLLHGIVWLANPVFWAGLWHWSKQPGRSVICGLAALALASVLGLRTLALLLRLGYLPDGRDYLGTGYYVWSSSMALLARAGLLRWASRSASERRHPEGEPELGLT